MATEDAAVQVTFIHKEPPCKKCLKAKDVVKDAIEECGVKVDCREVIAGTPEAAEFGAVFSPMVVIGGSVASAGFVPLKSGLVKLLRSAADAD